jgi:integrase
MATVKVKLKKHRVRNDGTYPVVIYVYEVKPQYIYTGYSVKEDQFKDGQGNWIRKHPDAAIINAKIEDRRAEVVQAIVSGVGYIEGMPFGVTIRSNFCDFLRKRGEQYKKDEKFDMGFKCIRMADEMKELSGRDIYSFEITPDYILNYITFCKKQGNCHNTVMRKVKNLRGLYKQAAKRGLATLPNPFEDYEIRLDPVNKEKLTMDQVKAIEDLPLQPGTTIFHVRNAWLSSFYCQGMRFESVCLLQWSNIRDGHIHYQMNKGKRWRSIEIHSKLQRILDYYTEGTPYIFPFFKKPITGALDLRNKKGSANAIVNNFLKIIAEMAGIAIQLKFHEARHSFSYQAKKKGVPTETIKDALGHGTFQMTEVYLKSLDDDTINEAVRSVWE